MSRAAQDWAAARTELDPKVRWTLWHLADHAHPDGRHAFPSVSTLAEASGCSDRTIQRHLKDLEALGYITAGDQTIVSALSPRTPGNRRPFVWNLAVGLGGPSAVPTPGPELPFTAPSPVVDEPVDNPPGVTAVSPQGPVDNPVRGDRTGRLGVTELCHPNQELNPTTQLPPQTPRGQRRWRRAELAEERAEAAIRAEASRCRADCEDPTVGSGPGWLADDPVTSLPRPCPRCRRHFRAARSTA